MFQKLLCCIGEAKSVSEVGASVTFLWLAINRQPNLKVLCSNVTADSFVGKKHILYKRFYFLDYTTYIKHVLVYQLLVGLLSVM